MLHFFTWLSKQWQQVINWLVDLNFGPQEFYPMLIGTMVEELSAKDLMALLIQAVPQKLVVELDGWAFHNDRVTFGSDRERDAALWTPAT